MPTEPQRAPRVIWQFKREQVERQDFSEFLHHFTHIPEGGYLRDSAGTFTILVDGYNNDPREIQEIPEVRAFYEKFSEVWPYWLFFIEIENLRLLIFCVLKTFSVRRDDKLDHVAFGFEDTEMLEFIQKQTPMFRQLCARAGMNSVEANARLQEITTQLMPSKSKTATTTRIRIHPHARLRMAERGALESEIIATVEGGEQFPAKFGRTGFRRSFKYEQQWHGRFYSTKQLEVVAVPERGWLVLTVIVRYF